MWELSNEVNHDGLVATNLKTGEVRYVTTEEGIRLALEDLEEVRDAE